jgi:protein tyrosine phosphatase (PTP) superfamily phosphohydrolase (DUF442 family)
MSLPQGPASLGGFAAASWPSGVAMSLAGHFRLRHVGRVSRGIVSILAGLILATATFRGQPQSPAPPTGPAAAKIGGSVTNMFRHLEAPGIENLFALSDRIYSGSSPIGDGAFAALAKLGVKTIITVDGAKPDLEAAARQGIRYIHIPVGYNGISSNSALQLVKAAETFPGPIYVHCHHGKHRGPTAAAIVCEGTAGWSPAIAELWLHTAGTATNYHGLYQTIRMFVPPSPDTLRSVPAHFPSKAEVAGLVDTMVQIDGHMDALKAISKADFRAPPDQPDLSPANESLILWELFREAHRVKLGSEKRGDNFLAELARAESSTGDLHSRLVELEAGRTAEKRATADAAFQSVTRMCASCHKAFRD